MNATSYTAFDVTTAATSSLVAFYNAHAAKPVAKFTDRATAERRVAALIAERTAQSQAPRANNAAHRAEVAAQEAAKLPKGDIVSLLAHEAKLEDAYAEAKSEGDWDRVNLVGLCLDDTRDELKAARAAAAARTAATFAAAEADAVAQLAADFSFRSNSVTGFADHGHVDCPRCGIYLINGVSTHGDDVNGKALRHDTHRYECMGCGGGFGAALAKKSLSRSTAIARTWAEPTIKAARAERTAVLVARVDGAADRGVVSDRTVYGSVAKAFRALGLNMGQHIGFRMALKAAGQKNFGPYQFTVQA
jgi:hypothetical protein